MSSLSTPIAAGRTAEIFAWEPGKVLKLFRPGFPIDEAEREAEIGRMVCAAGIPAPAVYGVVEVEKRRGVIYERIDGVSMLDKLGSRPWGFIQAARQMADLQLAMHASQPTGPLPGYRDRLQYDLTHAPALPAGLRTLALAALARLPDGASLCHGDFHPGNIILAARGPVVIDWMTACTGNPWADVARTQLLLTSGDIPDDIPAPLRLLLKLVRRSFFQTYLKRYLARRPDPQRQRQAWLPVIAAARLSENILPEQETLLKIAQAGLNGPSLSNR